MEEIIKGDNLPSNSFVTHYCSPLRVHNGVVLAASFELREQESYLSINWLDYFKSDIDSAVELVRKVFKSKGYSIKAKGKFAVLNNDKVINEVLKKHERELSFKFWPLDDDKSHSGIFGYTDKDQHIALTIHSTIDQDKDIHLAVI